MFYSKEFWDYCVLFQYWIRLCSCAPIRKKTSRLRIRKKRISIHFYRKYQKKLILIEFSTSRNKWFQNMISKLLVFMKWKRRVFSKPFLGIKLSINFNNSRNNQFVLFWFFKLCLNCYKVRINVVFLYQLYCLELYVFWLCSIEQLLGIEKKCKKTRF